MDVLRSQPAPRRRPPSVDEHLDDLDAPLRSLRHDAWRVDRWGAYLAPILTAGGRLHVVATPENEPLVARLTERLRMIGERAHTPLEVLPLTVDIAYLAAAIEQRGRFGDVMLILAARVDPRYVAAARAARGAGVTTWAMTSAGPNTLAAACDDALMVRAGAAVIGEVHLVAVDALCVAIERRVVRPEPVPIP